MKKQLLLAATIAVSSIAYAQVGINTATPKATLDVVSSPSDLAKTDGFIAPRLTGAELKAKDINYDTLQTGAIIYVTQALLPADTTTKTVNVTTVGYYYFDGSVWKALTSGGQEPWNVSGTNTQASANTQNIYQTGKVAVGFDPGVIPVGNLSVYENNTSGTAGTSHGIQNILTSNKRGDKIGISTQMVDNAVNGGGYVFGMSSGTTGMALSGNLSTSDMRGINTNVLVSAFNGNTANVNWLYGYKSNIGLNGNGIFNIPQIRGFITQFAPNITGTFNSNASIEVMSSYTDFIGSGNYNISRLTGLAITTGNNNGTKNIQNSFGLFISRYRFTGDTAANAYNLYSQGSDTKNYFEGRIGVGINTPVAQIHIVKQASDLTPAIIEGCNEYADNAAAVSAGLPIGALYRTGDFIKVVH
ncbi:hypothetical protein [Chryseobacterium sp. PMSZPI]|uniref:hypothetical protein n=1 Tax=Chryseobacterium sp. PMSZPI TaxID=1033900 RepID=UPI000C34F7BC|nr:hypothetical protein [Chryseobacterium sp. PMSZPI]PKF74587.1 hypothetical protein CW752_08435 [Chryseobacterium sp. PMSZPI]